MLFIYYFPNIPLEFNYWETDGKTIKYCDMSNWHNRLLGMLLPPATHLTTIDVTNIQSLSLIGDLNSQYKAPMMIPVTVQNTVFYPALSMISHPNKVRLNLKDGTAIDLDIAHDYTYSKNTTIQKLQQLFQMFGEVSINAIDSKGNQIFDTSKVI